MFAKLNLPQINSHGEERIFISASCTAMQTSGPGIPSREGAGKHVANGLRNVPRRAGVDSALAENVGSKSAVSDVT